MLPSARYRPPMRAMDLIVHLAVIFIISWLLYTFFASQRVETALPAELQRASQEFKSGNTNLAEAQIDRYLAANPVDADAFEKVCAICELYHRPDLMLRYAQRGLQKCATASGADRARLYVSLAGALAENDKANPKPARAAALAALPSAPDDPEILNSVGYILADSVTVGTNRDKADVSENTELLDKAEALVERAIRNQESRVIGEDGSGEIADFEDSYGWILYKKGLIAPPDQAQGYFTRSVNALRQAVNDLPDDAPSEIARTLYFHLAAACDKAGQTAGALSAIQIALRYDPTYQDALLEKSRLTIEKPASPSSTSPSSTRVPLSRTPIQRTPALHPAFTPLQSTPSIKPAHSSQQSRLPI